MIKNKVKYWKVKNDYQVNTYSLLKGERIDKKINDSLNSVYLQKINAVDIAYE